MNTLLAVTLWITSITPVLAAGSEADTLLQFEKNCLKGTLADCRKALDAHYNQKGGETGDRFFQIALKACTLGDKESCQGFLLNSPLRQSSVWGVPGIFPAPQALITYLTVDNLAHDVEEKPEPVSGKDGFVEKVNAAIKAIPDQVLKSPLLNVRGIFLVRHLGSTAWTQPLMGPDEKPDSAIIALDVEKLKKKANDWIRWKENTPFKPEAGWQLEATLERPDGDLPGQAIQYILLHELGHAFVASGRLLPPYWEPVPPDAPANFPFLNFSWVLVNGKFAYIRENDFPNRTRTHYYAEKDQDRLPISMAPRLYETLEKTDFASLYATMGPNEDFAESMASYVHMVLQKRPFEVRIKHQGKVVRTFKPCWGTERCKAKQKYFEDLFSQSSPPVARK